MEKTTDRYNTGKLYKMIESAETAELKMERGNAVYARFIRFGFDEDMGAFYFLIRKDEGSIKEIKAYPESTILIQSNGETEQEDTDITISGKMTAMTDFSSTAVRSGFKEMTKRSGFARELYESGSMRDFMMLKVVSDRIVVRTHRDAMANEPGVTIKPGEPARS